MIQELGLKNVHLWHEVEKNQVQSVLSAVDVCYIGLTKDPLFRYGVSPNKLFDYFYASKPIIYAIDSGDYKPVFDAGAGVEVEPESPDRVAEAILHLSKLSSEQRFEMGKNGRREVMAKYNYEALARSFVGIINE
jgi:glycosyltransferase involved in cell wall biosynthesis